MVKQWVTLEGARVLDAGCGVGAYGRRFVQLGGRTVGAEIELPIAKRAREALVAVAVAAAEVLPFADGSFDVVFSHEVLEHVHDDVAAASEMYRVLAPGGRLVLFCPNRWYPFETHGHYWRGRYHFGNTPLINYLPDPWRNRLAPHVRAYTGNGLRKLFERDGFRTIHHAVIFPGFDNIVSRRPGAGGLLRRTLYALERTPLQILGISHFIVFEKPR